MYLLTTYVSVATKLNESPNEGQKLFSLFELKFLIFKSHPPKPVAMPDSALGRFYDIDPSPHELNDVKPLGMGYTMPIIADWKRLIIGQHLSDLPAGKNII
jgi:hypothetical protein